MLCDFFRTTIVSVKSLFLKFNHNTLGNSPLIYLAKGLIYHVCHYKSIVSFTSCHLSFDLYLWFFYHKLSWANLNVGSELWVPIVMWCLVSLFFPSSSPRVSEFDPHWVLYDCGLLLYWVPHRWTILVNELILEIP